MSPLVPPKEAKALLETPDSLQKAHEAVLQALANRGYKVQEDTPSRIIAKLPFKLFGTPSHTVEASLDATSEKTNLLLKIDQPLL